MGQEGGSEATTQTTNEKRNAHGVVNMGNGEGAGNVRMALDFKFRIRVLLQVERTRKESMLLKTKCRMMSLGMKARMARHVKDQTHTGGENLDTGTMEANIDYQSNGQISGVHLFTKQNHSLVATKG